MTIERQYARRARCVLSKRSRHGRFVREWFDHWYLEQLARALKAAYPNPWPWTW